MSAPLKTSLLKALLLLGLAATLGGCSSSLLGTNEPLKSPAVQLTKVEIVKARVLEQQLVLRYRIDNPNNVSLPIRNLNYRVQLEGIELAAGDSGSLADVPANSYAYYEVPVQTNLWRQMKQVARLLKKKDQPVQYRVEGEINSGVFGQNMPVSGKGQLNSPTTVAMD